MPLDNCPQQIVLCGAEAAIDRAARFLQSEGAVAERLPFGRPYHTPLFASLSAPLSEFFSRLHLSPPKIDIYSCATAAKYPPDLLDLREDQPDMADAELVPQGDVVAQRLPVRRDGVDREARVTRHGTESSPLTARPTRSIFARLRLAARRTACLAVFIGRRPS